jgi:GH15 family glucan-1,4-alpha-glucosidase
MLEKGVFFQDQQRRGEAAPKEPQINYDFEKLISYRKRNIAAAVNHICDSIDSDGYVRAATDYTWYKLMWFRDSSLISSALSQAAAVLSNLADKSMLNEALMAKNTALKIISKEWDVIDKSRPKLATAASTPLQDPELKKLKNHLPARITKDGTLADMDIDGRHINDVPEAENQNSWLKQFDSIPLILYATSEFINSFGPQSLSRELIEKINSNLAMLSDYIIHVYKCPCADAWEQSPHMLHSYSVGAVFGGLTSALKISERLGIELDSEKINKEIYGKNGIASFINELFVKDGVLRKYRKEFGADVEEYPKVDASAYILFALLDKNHDLINTETYYKTMDALKENHIFKSVDGSRIYESAMPKRYEGDRYFGGAGWILLAALEASISISEGDISHAEYILSEIEKLIPKEGFKLPEQEPLEDIFLNPYRESESDAKGKNPAMDLIWSSAEYLRAATAELDFIRRNKQETNMLRK